MKVNISGRSAQEIFESVREFIDKGQLKVGDSLPSVRELSEQLGVNRNTVSSAYQRLSKAGLAVTQGRLGTRISFAQDAGEQEGVTETALFDLADGSPRRDWLPDLNELARCTHFNQYLYGEDTLLPEITAYAKHWFEADNHQNFDVTVCGGAIDTLERMMAAFLIPGDKVVVENPCYISSANAIRLAGMQVIGATVDEFGMRPDALERALQKGAKALLLTPRAHNPTGASISAQRAEQLKGILRNYPEVVVLEDDHFALMATTQYYSVIPDSTRHWAVFRSVSKGLGPDLRMAFVAADKESVNRITSRLAPGMSWVSRILQSLVHTCLTTESFLQGLHQAKINCESRRNILIKALAKNGITSPKIVDGLNVWIPVGGNCQAAAYGLSRKGWLVRPGSSFDIYQKSQAIRVSVQNMEVATAEKFAADLSFVIEGEQKGRIR